MIEQHPDIETLLAEAILNRPSYLDRPDIGQDHVEWAIAELERLGIHPSLKRIVRVLGRGTQRTLEPLINHYYRSRREKPASRSFDARDEALQDIFDVVVRHAREELRREFEAEALCLQEAGIRVFQELEKAKMALECANQRMQEAEVLKEGVRQELEDGRTERGSLQGRLEDALSELSRTSQALMDAQSLLSEKEAANSALAARCENLVQEGVVRLAELTAVEEKRTAAANTCEALQEELGGLRSRIERMDNQLAAEREKVREQVRQLRGLTKSEHKLSQQLAGAQSKLARERSSNTRLRIQMRDLGSELAALKRDWRTSQKALSDMERARDMSLAERSALKSQIEQAQRDQRREESRRFGRVERINQQILKKLEVLQNNRI